MNLSDLKSSINKFSISQMLSNNDGKTSSSAVIGAIVSLGGLLCFMFGCVDFAYISNKNDIMMYSGGIITVGVGLLGARKMKTDKSVSEEAVTVAGLPTPTYPVQP